MVLQEMQIDLTCPEELFQASSPAEFVFSIHSNPGPSREPISLVDTIRRLCAEPPVEGDAPDDTEFLKGASKLNFFTIATGERNPPKELSTISINNIFFQQSTV